MSRQLEEKDIGNILHELDLFSRRGLGAEAPEKSLTEFIKDFRSIAARGAARHVAFTELDSQEQPGSTPSDEDRSDPDEGHSSAAGAPACSQRDSDAAQTLTDQAALKFPHLMVEDPRLMLSETQADAITSLLMYVVGKSVGCDQRNLTHFMHVLESWLAAANIHMSTPDTMAEAAGVRDAEASGNILSAFDSDDSD